jgi:hypothetical protein
VEVERSSIIRRVARLIVNRMAQPNRWAICFLGRIAGALASRQKTGSTGLFWILSRGNKQMEDIDLTDEQINLINETDAIGEQIKEHIEKLSEAGADPRWLVGFFYFDAACLLTRTVISRFPN